MSKISIIAAIADNLAIGKSNKLLWHLPADLKHFKELTTGHTIVMGKRTYNSLPIRPLPKRKNVILTTMLSEGVTEGYFEAESIEDALDLCEKEHQIFIIGGATVYKQCIDKADSMYLTWVHGEFEADAFFPKINFKKWTEVSREDHEADENNPYAYSFVYYEKIK
jgi:dihydrofolate reductase